MSKGLSWLALVVFIAAGLAFKTTPARAANNGELVQAVGDSKVYYIEGSYRRHIADAETFRHWGFNAGLIKKISRAELNSHQEVSKLTRVIHWGGIVYFIENGTRRYVTSVEALMYSGYSFSQLVDVNTDTFHRLPEGAPLEAAKAVRVPGDSRIFYLEGGQRRPFKNESVAADYLYFPDQVSVSAAAQAIPVGPTLTNIVDHNGTVWVVMGRKRFYIPNFISLEYNEMSTDDISRIGDSIANELPLANEDYLPPIMVKMPNYHKIWFVEPDGTRRWVPSLEIMEHWGLSVNQARTISENTINKYPESSALTRFVRNGQKHYYMLNGQKREVVTAAQFNVYGLTEGNRIDMGTSGLNRIGNGPALEPGLTSLDGYNIPTTSGKVGKEQHLYLDKDEADLGRTDASANVHYGRSGTPTVDRNGMAGGYGAFGSEASPALAEQERYYINMRWSYCNWYEDPSTLDSFGRATTRCGDYNGTSKNWHRHKKVIVINPSNGKQIVASVEESGPAIWTGRVSGLSPEAMTALGAVTNTNLSYYWAANQDIGLGPLY